MYLRRALDEFDGYSQEKLGLIECLDESLTHQSFKDECDINIIVAKFGIGEIPIANRIPLESQDQDDYPTDFMTAQLMVNDAVRSFMSLPAQIRSRFENNAMAYADYAANPENQDQMALWGLAKPREIPTEKPKEEEKKT
jgi:hypothetical protein